MIMGYRIPPGPTKRSDMGYRTHLFLLVFSVLVSSASAFPAFAERVVFIGMRVLDVEKVDFLDDDFVKLTLEGGATITIERKQIRQIREDSPAAVPEPIERNRRTGEKPARVDSQLWRTTAGRFAGKFAAAARRHGVEPELLLAVALAESALDPNAVSHKGALGLMQLMPGTAREMNLEDPMDPGQNIDGGARWLRRLLDHYEGDLDLTLAAYNAGQAAVARHGGIPPFPETVEYIDRVRRKLRNLAADRGQPG